MRMRFKCLSAATVVIGLAAGFRPAGAEVTFFLQPEQSGLDGEARYLEAIALGKHLGSYALVDFDDLDAYPRDSEVHALWADDVFCRLQADIAGSILAPTGHTGPYIFNPSGYYVWPGRAFFSTLVMGDRMTLLFDEDHPRAGAVGFWIFDDQRSLDSIYRVDVLETCGGQATTFLANDIPRDADGYEIEGFVGIVSDVGIRRVVVTPVDPVSRVPHSDIFEIDYLTIGQLRRDKPCGKGGGKGKQQDGKNGGEDEPDSEDSEDSADSADESEDSEDGADDEDSGEGGADQDADSTDGDGEDPEARHD